MRQKLLRDDEPYRRPRRRWWPALSIAIVLLLSLAWTGLWFFAASATQDLLSGWQAREAKLGHTYACARHEIGGYPFQLALRCTGPSAEFRGSPPLSAKAKDITITAQIWDPTLLVGEFAGPLTVAQSGQPGTMGLTWSVAHASVRGLPSGPERIVAGFEKPALARVGAGGTEALAAADRVQIDAHLISGSAAADPVVEIAASLAEGTAPAWGGLAAQPVTAEMVGVLRGLKDLLPRPLSETLRALQAANGRLEITRARLQQGELVATGTGTLGLSPRGALDGTLQVTVVNVEKLLPALGIDRAISQFLAPSTLDRLAPGLDKLLPGLGGVLRGNPAGRGGADALGQRTELEGKSALTLPLRFADGLVLLGPFRLGQVPPLY